MGDVKFDEDEFVWRREYFGVIRDSKYVHGSHLNMKFPPHPRWVVVVSSLVGDWFKSFFDVSKKHQEHENQEADFEKDPLTPDEYRRKKAALGYKIDFLKAHLEYASEQFHYHLNALSEEAALISSLDALIHATREIDESANPSVFDEVAVFDGWTQKDLSVSREQIRVALRTRLHLSFLFADNLCTGRATFIVVSPLVEHLQKRQKFFGKDWNDYRFNRSMEEYWSQPRASPIDDARRDDTSSLMFRLGRWFSRFFK